jgi:MoxR-like ATPase
LALLRGRDFVLPQDIYDVAPDVLRHRVLLSYEAIADGVTAEHIVNRVVGTVLAPRLAPSQDNAVAGDAGVSPGIFEERAS